MTQAGQVTLREVIDDDIVVFFEQQRDPSVHDMVPFLDRDPDDEAGFRARWQRMRLDPKVRPATVLFEGRVAGYLMSFERDGAREVGYWYGRAYWGRGIATHALAAFLRAESARPLQARAVADNLASRRVLEKCGFTQRAIEHNYAPRRGAAVDEALLELR